MKKNLSIAALALALSTVLTACPSTSDPLTPPNAPGTGSATPPELFVPEVGAAVGTGTGIGKVLISPNKTDMEMFNLVNEVRTRGTLGGEKIPWPTCADPNIPTNDPKYTFAPGKFKPLTYDGNAALMAHKHAYFLGKTATEFAHVEPLEFQNEPFFYGVTLRDRIVRALKESGSTAIWEHVGENVGRGYTDSLTMVTEFMRSEGHCENIMNPDVTAMGMGHVYMPENSRYINGVLQSGVTTKWGTAMANNWVQVFTRYKTY